MRTAILFLLLATAAPAAAQTRAGEIAAEFTKSKHATKTKHGVTTKKFLEVTSSTWEVGDLREYAGRYVSVGDPMQLEIHVSTSGAITARGTDAQPFEIENVKIEAALLSGTKVYRDGRRERFEGAFMIRSERAGPDEPLTTTRGIGVPVDAPAGTGIIGTLHVFLKKDSR
jgi:hypothetical protein